MDFSVLLLCVYSIDFCLQFGSHKVSKLLQQLIVSVKLVELRLGVLFLESKKHTNFLIVYTTPNATQKLSQTALKFSRTTIFNTIYNQKFTIFPNKISL